jgi:hypothetical protein
MNAAYSLDLHNTLGSIERGEKASFILTHPMPSLAYLPYAFGQSTIASVWIRRTTPKKCALRAGFVALLCFGAAFQVKSQSVKTLPVQGDTILFEFFLDMGPFGCCYKLCNQPGF